MTLNMHNDPFELVIASVLLNDAAAGAAGELRVSDFPQHLAPWWEAITILVKEGRGVDAASIESVMPTKTFAKLGGLQTLLRLTELVCTPSMIRNYVEWCRDDSTRRTLLTAVEDVKKGVLANTPVDDLVGALERSVTTARMRSAGHSVVDEATAAELHTRLFDWWSSEADDLTRFKYPWHKANSEWGGYGAGELIVVCGYSGDGKSVAGLQMFDHVTAMGESAAYFSLEMPSLQVGRRLLAMGSISLTQMKQWSNRRREDLTNRMMSRLSELTGRQLRVYGGNATIGSIRAEQAKHHFDVIFVDHLHRMQWRERSDLEAHVKALKNLALDSGCAVVLLAQLARREGFPRPALNQLRETSVIENEADAVFAAYRRRGSDGMRTDAAELVCLKMRDGASDMGVQLTFDWQRMKFEEQISTGRSVA